MIVVDASVVIAGLHPAHDAFDVASAVLARGPGLPAHGALEAYSVLTRMPGQSRVPPAVAVDLLRRQFPAPWLLLTAAGHLRLLATLAGASVPGGAVHDALIAAAALEAGATLVSLDRRAERVYRLVGVDHEIVGSTG